MITVFAVDPAIFSDWSDYLSLQREFGFSKARVISKFPKKWQKMAYEASQQLTTMQQKKLTEWFNNAKSFLVKTGLPYDSQMEWIKNAEQAISLSNEDINTIISLSNPRKNSKILVIQNGIFDNEKLFYCPTEKLMPRTIDGFKDVCKKLLKFAEKDVFLVDPYFSGARRFIDTLEVISTYTQNDNADIHIKIFTTIDDSYKDDNKIEEIEYKIKRFINNNKNIEVIFTQKDKKKDHNRYILTDKAGIKFPWGLDTSEDCDEDVVNIMDDNTYEKIYNKYCNLDESKIIKKIIFNKCTKNV